MQARPNQLPHLLLPPSLPRRFVYRSTEQDPQQPHPLRRSTDLPCASDGQFGPRPILLRFRVFLKLN